MDTRSSNCWLLLVIFTCPLICMFRAHIHMWDPRDHRERQRDPPNLKPIDNRRPLQPLGCSGEVSCPRNLGKAVDCNIVPFLGTAPKISPFGPYHHDLQTLTADGWLETILYYISDDFWVGRFCGSMCTVAICCVWCLR